MIDLELPWLVFAYLLVFLAAIFSAWIAYETVRRYRERHAQRDRLQCGICGMEYEDHSGTDLPKCPRCGSLNERQRIKSF